MSMRYRCSSNGCSVTINGYDQRVMEQIPDHLASEFPAYLTHRCAISKTLGNLIRPCIQNGMGVERFRHTLQELHTLQHDRLELQYLNSVAYRRQNLTLGDMLNISQRPPSFSRFDDPKRYAGCIPSTAYLRLVYTSIMDQLRPLIDRQMMQLGGQILKGDHSFKIIKNMAKIGSAPVFSALYTVCNEYEEIRIQVLNPSKTLSHLRDSFQRMLHSYNVYGHKPPELFFTDNVQGDQKFLQEDIFHLMDMIKVPKRHGLAKEFSRRLRDAIFVVDGEDHRLVEIYLASKNITWNYMLTAKPSWILRRVKRIVPPTDELLPVVDNLFKKYDPLICTKTGLPLFDREAWKQASHVLEVIRLGYVSDPAGYSLYFKIGHDENQLLLYRCSRGTNTLEGGVHQNIVRKLMSFSAGPHLIDSALADYRLRHNIDVGTINRYGHIHKGHYAPWLVKTISTMYKKLGIFDHGSGANQTSTCLYDTESNSSNETFGIVSFARNLAEDLHIDIEDRDNQHISQVGPSLSVGMSTYFVLQSTSTNNPKGQMYKYLAEKQVTKYAVVPVHTPEEFSLFKQLMDRYHGAQLHADWKEMAKSWNTDHTNGVTIFYKTPENLKAHCGVWDERRVANDSIAGSADICEVMREQLQSPGRARAIIPAQIPSSAEVPITIAQPSRPSYLPSRQTTGSNSGTTRNIIPNVRDPCSSSRQTSFNLADLPKKSTHSVTATAHHSYEAQREDELSFATGEIIHVTDRNDADWWFGKKEDGTNLPVDGKLAEKLTEKAKESVEETTTTTVSSGEQAAEIADENEKDTPPQQPIGMARVMKDYAMQDAGELTLHTGGIITVYETLEDGWSRGELNGKTGRFPTEYVEDIDMPGRPDIGSPTTATAGKKDAGEEGEAGKPGFKLAAFGVKQGGIGSLLAGGFPVLKKAGKKEDVSTNTAASPTQSSPVSEAKAPAESKAVKATRKAIALHPYDAENSDELTLIRGEYIEILDRNADEGWWEGVNEKGQSGIFPANFVKEMEEESAAPVLPQRSRKSVASVSSVRSIEPPAGRPALPTRDQLSETSLSKDTTVIEEKNSEEVEATETTSTEKEEPTNQESPETSSPLSPSKTPIIPVKEQDVMPVDTSEPESEPISDTVAATGEEKQVEEQVEEQVEKQVEKEAEEQVEEKMEEQVEEPAGKPVEEKDSNTDDSTDAPKEDSVKEKSEEHSEQQMSEKAEVSESLEEEIAEQAAEKENVEEKKPDFGMQPTGPKLSTPNRARLGKPRRSPQLSQNEPSQMEMLQQDIDQNPPEEPKEEKEESQTPPPKPVKPIFAKFPTPFAAGMAELNSKQLKPVQRRMWEPVPAHEPKEPSEPKEDKSADEPPRPTGVKNIASRFNFGGVPSGGGNDVLETKLKNFAKNEVDKARKEFEQQLEEEREQRRQLEKRIEALVRTVEELESRLG
ncbi:hypothetical protein DFQ29_002903 [Apophysomyces sp. BC1021]|nr:hypothetical protein DFQ29_002903 [Apophysomyces sp. BC1021]